MKNIKRVGCYVTAHPDCKDARVYYVYDIDEEGRLAIEDVQTGASYDLVDPNNYVVCKKPVSPQHRTRKLIAKYAELMEETSYKHCMKMLGQFRRQLLKLQDP